MNAGVAVGVIRDVIGVVNIVILRLSKFRNSAETRHFS